MSDFHFEEEEFSTEFNDQTIRRIFKLLTPYKAWAIGFISLVALTAVSESLFAYINKLIIDEGIIAQDHDRLIQLMKMYGGLIVLMSCFVFGFIYLTGLLGERVRYDLRRDLFNHLQSLSFSYFDKTPVGWIMSRVSGPCWPLFRCWLCGNS
jgi:ATP-binding cassette subfamily B protein